MSFEFVGRKRELAALEQAWKAGGGGFIPVYGRRRVGKSELLVKFVTGKPAIYATGKVAPAGLQIREFLRAAASALAEPLLANHPAADWPAAFRLVEERWKGPGKLIIALDEFQWMAAASPELPSVLQECWDRRWRNGRIMLILCGSYLGFMEREVLGKKSPLFGRRTAQILLRPFAYREAAKFHPHWSRPNQAAAYLICGGLPFYLRCFSPSLSIEQNLAATVFDELGLLFREPDFLLREELREVSTYNAILLALAAGSPTNSEISKATGIGDRALHYYLSTLVELGYVQRRFPLTGAPPTARQVRYSLEDPLLRFWFRFVYPNLSLIARLGAARAVRELVLPELDSYFGYGFERLCREALPALYAHESVRAGFEVGEYWDKDTQIDVVGLRQDNWTDLGECKWGHVPSATALRSELSGRLLRFPNARQATLGLRFFTRQRMRVTPDASARERWHCLDDLYELD
jgi:AAA+ ATPase superfamily predicted ATPase